jgi:hypothetical protein
MELEVKIFAAYLLAKIVAQKIEKVKGRAQKYQLIVMSGAGGNLIE